MKHLQDNTRLLEKTTGRLNEEVKRLMKFSKGRLEEQQIVKMCLEQLQ
jgi:hypothetical protein